MALVKGSQAVDNLVSPRYHVRTFTPDTPDPDGVSPEIQAVALVAENGELATTLNPIPVTGTITGTSDVNITKYGGTATTLGQKAMAASIPVVVASDQSTLPISAASLPLPSGAATSALQLPNSHDVTVDNASGASAVNIQDGGNSITVDGTVAATQSGSWSLAANQSVNVAQMNGVATTMGAGASGTGTQRVVTATDSTIGTVTTVTTLTNITNQGQLVDNAAFTDGTTRLNMGGFIFDEVAGTALTENDAAAARIDSKRAQIGIIEDGATRGRWATVTAANAVKVDGSAVTQPVSAASLPLPTGAATSANQSTLITQTGSGATGLGKAEDAAHTTGDVGVMALGVRQDGNAASISSTTGDYEPIKTDGLGRLKVGDYGYDGLPVYHYNYAGILNVPVMLFIDPVSLQVSSVVNNGVVITGDEAHDAVDDGNPAKIGYRARDYTPDTSDTYNGGLTAVAENDRANATSNLFGQPIEGVNSYFFTLDNVSATYSTSTNLTSTAKACWNYRQATFSYEITKTGSPTDILFEIEVSLNNGSTYTVLQNDFLGDLRESAASIGSGIKKSVTFPIGCSHIRVKATSTVPSGSIIVANAVLYLRN